MCLVHETYVSLTCGLHTCVCGSNLRFFFLFFSLLRIISLERGLIIRRLYLMCPHVTEI